MNEKRKNILETFVLKRQKIDEVREHESTTTSESASEDEDCNNNTGEDTSITNTCTSATNLVKPPYKQKYKESWEKNYIWLTSKNNSAFCKVCDKNIPTKLSLIQRHEKTQVHQNNMKRAKNTPQLQKFGFNNDLVVIENDAKVAEFKLTLFLHEHNLPFLIMEHLVPLLQSTFKDSKIAKSIKCSRTKATQITVECLASEATEKIVRDLGENYFSLIIDETTDIATKKCLAVLIRFWNGRDVKDTFLGLIQLSKCDADSIFKATCDLLRHYKISVNKLVGFAADNAAVMMGNRKGVQMKFKEINENMFVMGCTCHSFHLCASAAALKLPKSIEEFARNVYNYFANSTNRTILLQEFQNFVDINPCKILHPSQTRWLSLQQVVNRLLHSWDALKLYFIDAVVSENLNVCNSILECLNTPVVKMYLTFLSYILEQINNLNLEFQSEKPKIYTLHKKVSELYRSILRNFIKIEILNNTELSKIDVLNPRNFLQIEEIYFGAKVDLLIKKGDVERSELMKFQKNVLSFYVELSSQIKSRFDFNDPFLQFLGNFEPNLAVSGKVNSIIDLLHFFPCLEESIDIERLNLEYRRLADIEEIKVEAQKTFSDFWAYVCCMKNEINEPMFPNLTEAMKIIMCLPHSSAAAERVFSKLNLVKTKLRNKLDIDTCSAIILSCNLLEGAPCYTWTPSQTLMKKRIAYKPKPKNLTTVCLTVVLITLFLFIIL